MRNNANTKVITHAPHAESGAMMRTTDDVKSSNTFKD